MIQEKIYYFIKFTLESPLSIGSGETEFTDHDILKDSAGKPFIPATSLAGSMIHYLDEEEKKIVNPKEKSENLLSPFFISDANLTQNTGMGIRDGVKLDENKVSEDGAKYDMEILDAGSQFNFRIEVTVRDDNKSEEIQETAHKTIEQESNNEDTKSKKMQKIVDKLMYYLNMGNITLGMKSKRGLGKVKVNECRKKAFTRENISELIEFKKYDVQAYDEYIINKDGKLTYETEIKEEEKLIDFKNLKDDKFDNVSIKVKQLGGLSIRAYSAKAGDVDYRNVSSNNTPVIPGTSWVGMIRKQMNYYNSLFEKEGNDYNLDDWFGFVREENKKAQASNIIFEESKIQGGTKIEMTRNKIDRFSGGSADGALYSEEAVFNGNTVLNIKIKKDIKGKTNAYVLGLLALTIKDLANGLIAIGGQTAIGRGILEVEEVSINEKQISINGEQSDLDNYISNLAKVCKTGASKGGAN